MSHFGRERNFWFRGTARYNAGFVKVGRSVLLAAHIVFLSVEPCRAGPGARRTGHLAGVYRRRALEFISGMNGILIGRILFDHAQSRSSKAAR